MSLRARLQLALTLVLCVWFSIFGLLEYRALGSSLLSEVDEDLVLQAKTLAHHGVLDPLAGRYAEILNADGTPRYLSQANVHLPRPQQVGAFETVEPRPGVTLRLYSQRLPDGGMLLLAQSLHLLEGSAIFAAGKLLAMGLLTLLTCVLVTYAVLGHGLRPLHRVAQVSREIIKTGDVSQRVPVPPGLNDKVGQVAVSFNALLERVEELLQTQARLLSDTSHELRNPLMVIQTDLDMLGRDLDAQTREEVVQEAALEVARVTRLVEDLLLLSWAESHPSFRPERLQLDELARRCVARVAAVAGEKVLSVEAADPIWVAGDRDRLEQILRNLLVNSVKYTGDDGVITVKVARTATTATVAVVDNGCGIAPEHLVHIFERFYRVDPSRNRGSGGVGLGLPLAKALAQMHGGDLTAHSEAGRGSTFTVELPLTT